MTTLRFARYLLLLVLPVCAVALLHANGEPTRLLRSSTVSATQIAFTYANNVWVVERGGGVARRVTSFQGQTTNPHFSPDGQWIAFTGEYAGNADVYVVAAEGGEPRRLTWHPDVEIRVAKEELLRVRRPRRRVVVRSMIAPRGGFFTREGKWAVENEGVAPDIDVENFPKDVIAGHDPQLERAVEEAMRLLKANAVDRKTTEPPPPTWGKRKGGS